MCWHGIESLLCQHGLYFYNSQNYMYNKDAFHTRGIGQFDVLYVRPMSSNMPKWLVDLLITRFHSVELVVEELRRTNPKVPQKNIRSSSMEDKVQVDSSKTFSIMSYPSGIFGLVMFVAGYFMGGIKNQSKPRKATR